MKKKFPYELGATTGGRVSMRLIIAILAVLIAASGGIFFSTKFAQAATYNFSQSSWIGGVTANTATHVTNQTGWTQYSAATGVTAGANVQLPAPTSYAFVDDGATSTTPVSAIAKGGVFSSGTNSNTAVTGTGISANVTLASTPTAVNAWDTVMSAVPAAIGVGSTAIRNGSDDDIYVTQANGGTGFWKYTISSNTWTTLTVTPAAIAAGSSMLRNGVADDIYVTQGGGNNGLYKYSISGNSWTTLTALPVTNGWGIGWGGVAIRNGADDDIYVMLGGSFASFYKYSISGNSWTALTAVPSVVYYGGRMIRNAADNDIYVMPGNSTTAFYKYSISGNSWTTLTAAPATAYMGGKMLRNGADNDIFVTTGQNTGFYKYSISGNSWTTLTALPVPSTAGGDMIRNAADNDIYVTTANAFNVFYKYSISGNSWTALTAAPATVGHGSMMLRNGADNDIYVTQGGSGGGSAGFHKYSISGNSWTGSSVSSLALPPGAISGGARMIRNGADDTIYVTRGGGQASFYKYSISGNSWVTLTAVPAAVNSCSAMLRNGADNDIYVLQGNGTGFYKYSISGNSWTTLAVVPGVVSYGCTATRNGADNDIYVVQGNGTGFHKYSISGNSWVTLTAVPATVGYGRISRNGADDDIYLTVGASTGFYKYSISGNSWVTLTAAPGNVYDGSLLRNGADNDIYVVQGNGTGFHKYSISGNSWVTLTAVPGTIYASGSTELRNGADDDIYVTAGGGSSSGFYKYSISGNSWMTMRSSPSAFNSSNTVIRNGSDNSIYALAGSGSTAFYTFIINNTTYAPTGTFVSAAIDTGALSSFATMTFDTTLPATTGITMDVRASADSVTWTSWTLGVLTGGSISALSGNRYFQYRANLSTGNANVTPTLNGVTVNYNQYGTGSLISSIYDSGAATNLIAKLSWTATGTSTADTIRFQIRSSSDGITWSNWCGPSTGCLGSDYFQDADNGVALAAGHPLQTGSNDRYLQYQVFVTSGGSATPILVSVTPQYVVNAPPDFDATYGTNGVTVSQVTSSADPNWGKVSISYSVRDTDTSTGSNTPGYVTPSFEYSTDSGSTWNAIPSADLASDDIANKIVNNATYNTYSAAWNATSTIPSAYSTVMKVRVTANDNEAANNTTQAVSGLFTLDTKAPTLTGGHAHLDSSTGVSTANLVLTSADDSQMQYRACNDIAFPITDAIGNSCAWSVLGTNLASTTITWTPTGTPNTETAYVQLRDALGNVTSQTIVAPAVPSNFDFKDVSNVAINSYWEFVSWGVFANTTGSTFSNYKLYNSTDGVTYNVLTTITDSSLNYYRDNISTATSSLHYYKVLATDTDGDISHFTTVLADIPNGQGGSDSTPPTITAVAVPGADLKNSSAKITFTTDEIAQATIQYRVSGAPSWTTVTSPSYLTSQSTYITGLAPNTTYNLQVRAADVVGNMSAYTAGPDFTTPGGPVISNVTTASLSDISATIFWNTSTSSDSYVYYSVNSALSNPSTAGSAALVDCISGVCQHQVTISGLTAGRQYYYYVKSTDGLANSSTDTNTGSYYTFTTTLDTTPPVISGISTPVMAAEQVVVVWKTDELATSQVLYGTASGDLPKNTVTETTKSIYHVVTLSAETTNAGVAGGTNELTPVTRYYYVVRSADIAGNTTTSAEQTFTTPSTGDVTIVAVSVTNTVLNTGAGTTNNPTPDTTPPVISAIKATNIDSFDENISFSTNENAVSFVDYGKDTTYGISVGDSTSIMSHSIKLINLTMGTAYHYRIKAIDAAGNMTTSEDRTFRTPFLSEQQSSSTIPLDDATLLQSKIEDLVQSALPSLTAPFVTVPQVTDITEHGATVTWTTNVKAYGLLGYAADDEFSVATSTYSSELSSSPNRETTHTVVLKNLKSNTKYHIQAKGYVFQNVVGKSDDITFSTKPAQIEGSIAERTKNSFTVVWTTDEPASSVIEYKDTSTGIVARSTDDAMRTAHSVKVENLPSGITYRVDISGKNKEGNTLEAVRLLTVTTSRDVTPPAISGFKVDNALVPGRTDRIQTIVSWKTDEPSDSVVYYEEGAGTPNDTRELANKVALTGSFVTSHAVILPGLKPGAIYRLKVTSDDDSGNRATFGPRTVITPQQTQSITDVIFKNFEDSFKFLQQIR